jgi:hydrogenase-4 component E
METTATVSFFSQQVLGLVGGLFLLTTFGLIVTRQLLANLTLFTIQSALLAASALTLGFARSSTHLLVVAGLTVVVKPLLIPWLLRRTVGSDIFARRDISQVLNIPTVLLVGVGLATLSYFIARPLLDGADAAVRTNLPIGMAGLFLGVFAMTVRREAISQVLAILSMENGAFFAGIAIAPGLPLMAELAASFDMLIIALVMGLLAKKIHERVGTTSVGELVALKEDSTRWNS